MTKATYLATGITAIAATALGAIGLSGATATRADCPGKIVCPITGELVCRDECPRVDANRADCPGKIECPIDGGLICKDRCPAGGSVAEAIPPCCAGG